VSAPIQTIGGRRFSFGKLSATNAVRVHVALLKVLGEPVVKLLVLGKDRVEAPKDLPRQHAEPGTEAPPLPGVTPAPAAVEGEERAGADDINVLGFSLTGDDVLTIGAAIGLMADRMKEDEFIALIALVLSSVKCEGHQISNIDVIFGDGGSMDMYRVFWEALKANFAGFFPARLFASVVKRKAQ
jgi:hypothetical protein